MGVKVSITGSIATQAWDAQAMAALASTVLAAVTERTFDRGIGEDGTGHKAYSTRPLKMYKRSDTARRMSPKGGASFAWVRGPRLPGGGCDKSKIGQEGGRFYGGGYAEYKRASRKGLTNRSGATGVEVNLTLSGQLSRSLRVIRASRTAATIGITGAARLYGSHVDAARPFLGLSPQDGADLEPHFSDIMAAAMERGARGAR